MIEHVFGNVLETPAEALVNTVNTVGVMGKGIALQFRKAFPANYDAYVEACKRDEVVIGRVFVTELTGQLTGPRLIINFPTKEHWRSSSRLADIAAGLVDLRQVLIDREVRSIAVPPLGCGLGGLNWTDVRPLIEAALDDLPLQVFLFPPQAAPEADVMPDARPPEPLTPPRAALVGLLARYLEPGTRATLLEIQKLLYFLQEAGEKLRLVYGRQRYGPYADNVRHVLKALEGQYTTGFGDGTSVIGIALLDGAERDASTIVEGEIGLQARMSRVLRLIESWNDPYGLELLATTHWVATRDGAADLASAIGLVQDWSERKGRLFTDRHINLAWDHLIEQGFLPSVTTSRERVTVT